MMVIIFVKWDRNERKWPPDSAARRQQAGHHNGDPRTCEVEMTLGENFANSAVGALESVESVDGAALKIAGAVTNAVPVGAPRDALSGTWLGHALHPALTDVVIGSFLSATLLDLLGGDDTGRARERLIEIGLAAADRKSVVYGRRVGRAGADV